MADPPPVLTLHVIKGLCEGKTLQRRAGAAPLRVGRVAKGNDLFVRDPGASQKHLTVEFLPPPASRWAVTDLDSSNGSLLNGTPLVPTIPAPVSDGDLIKIGESTVLAVTISTDAGPGPGPASIRRSARNAAAVAAAAAEKAPAVSRRAGRRKAGASGAPEAGNEVEEEAVLPASRGGRKKAAEPTSVVEAKEEEEEAAIPHRGRSRKAGGRKKAVEATAVVEAEEEEEEEAAAPAIQHRGRSRKAAATVVVPPQPQSTRATRAAARRGEVLRSENDEGEAAGARDRKGTAAEGKGEVEPAAGRGRAKRGRGGRGRATKASARKAEDAIIENDENEQEERDMADGRERGVSPLKVLAVNDGSEEDKVATEDDKLDGTSKASMEDETMVDVEEDAALAERATEGRVNAQHSPAENGAVEEEEANNLSKGRETEVDQELREKVSPESKLDVVGEVEENDNREAVGASGEKGHVGERTGRQRLENMTLGEWFVQIEKFLLAKNEEAAEKAIAEVQEKHRRFCEHVRALKLKNIPAP